MTDMRNEHRFSSVDSQCIRNVCTIQAAQVHYMNAGVTLACKRCCVTNGYLQRFVWDVNGFSEKREKVIFLK